MYTKLFKLHADLLKSLAHPRRLEIIHLLRDQQMCVSDIHQMLDLPQANVSQHLMVLRDAGVVETTRQGKNVFYTVTHPNFIKVSDLLREVLILQHADSVLADEFALKMKDLVPLVHDPVCQMRLSPKTAAFATKYQGDAFYFCASGCLSQFEKNPIKYVHEE